MSYIEIFGSLFDASIDGTNISTKDFYCYDIKKPLSGKQDIATINIPKKHGLIVTNKKFTTYGLILNGFIQAANYSTLKAAIEDLSAFLHSDIDREIILSNQDDRYWMGQYIDYDIISDKDDYTLIDLNFTCFDPLAYDNTATTDTQEDFDTNDDTYVVANSGHTYAYPVITITFNQPQTHIYVDNYTVSNSRFDISKAFIANDELEIDCKNGTVKLNGTADYTGFGSGGQGKANWLKLAVGNNSIYAGTDDADIDVDIQVQFNKPYLY